MNAISVERDANSETVTIVGFVLTEADGGGVRDIECGYVSTEQEARAWKGRAPIVATTQPLRPSRSIGLPWPSLMLKN